MASYPYLNRRYGIRISKNIFFLKDMITYRSWVENAEGIAFLHLCNGSLSIEELLIMTEKKLGGRAAAEQFVQKMLQKYEKQMELLPKPVSSVSGQTSFLKQLAFRQSPWPYYEQREESPYEIFLTLTKLCNHRCNYCFQGEKHGQKEEISTETWKDVLYQASEMGIQGVTFSGGEPLLHPGFFELLEYANSLGMFIKVNTNGTLCTEKTAKRLKECGVGFVQVSLPTLDAASYDSITSSQGELPAMIEGIYNLKKQGLFVRAKMVLTPMNCKDAEEVMDFCFDAGIEHLHLGVFVLTWDGMQYLLPAENDLVKIHEIAQRKQALFGDKIIIGGPHLGALHWKDETCIIRCGGMKDTITILADGTITYCEPMVDLGYMKFGNAKTDKLADIWNSPLPDEANGLKDPCATCAACEFYQVCGGGCPMFSALQTGTPQGVDPRCFKSPDKPNLFERGR